MASAPFVISRPFCDRAATYDLVDIIARAHQFSPISPLVVIVDGKVVTISIVLSFPFDFLKFIFHFGPDFESPRVRGDIVYHSSHFG